jgi:hypothetical protein
MMCDAAKDPNIFLKMSSIAGWPSALADIALEILVRQCVTRHLGPIL